MLCYNASMIKAVIFDYDGVIVDNRVVQCKTWKILMKRYGITITKYHLDNITRGRSVIDVLRYFLKDRFDEAKLREIEKERLQIYQSLPESKLEPMLGLIPFLKKLKENKILLAITTSSKKDVLESKMQNHNITKYFDMIVTSDKIKNCKPHPEIYLKTAEVLNVKPEECVVFEDAKSGIESANKAGMKVVLVMTAHKKHEFPDLKIDKAIKDFNELSVSDIIKL